MENGNMNSIILGKPLKLIWVKITSVTCCCFTTATLCRLMNVFSYQHSFETSRYLITTKYSIKAYKLCFSVVVNKIADA